MRFCGIEIYSRVSNNLILHAGSWFPRGGKLDSWRFQTNVISGTSEVRLQIYRLTCQSDETPLAPGN